MANGKTFDELRKMAEEGTDIGVKPMLRLIMAGMADMHEADNLYREDTTKRLMKIESVTKYPSALWYFANMPLKTVGFFALLGLIAAVVFIPEARQWAFESIVKTLLGGL